MSHVRYAFVDCRWSLDDPDLGLRAYRAGHIPGAAFLDVERDLSSPPGRAGRHPLPTPEQFADAASRAGIGEDVFVVAYGSLGGAERLWWLLRHFGHGDCAVIDLDAWHGPLASGDEPAEPARFVPRERNDDTVGRDELVARHGELVVVDARVPSRWRGEANAVDRVPGRIPGAVNAPWNEPVPAALPAGDVVAYCGSGVTACVVLHRLHLAGRDGRLYPGSWSEWEQYPELPVERST
jgi:thiosulfate/3-mercaptopyruvate sulfurtransferase